MRDKIIYGTVRQYHIWFILRLIVFNLPLDKRKKEVYSMTIHVRIET